MLDINSIASQVKYNCNISDAIYWGIYSPCGLLLRLRDLYKFEVGINPGEKINHDKIVTWIGKREKLWEKLSGLHFQKIEINNKKYHPFNVRDINSILMNKGFLYGAGYGDHLKPSFLFANILKKLKSGKYSIHVVGKEIARDLSTAPAMLQGNTIIARYETMKFFIMEKYEELKSNKYRTALSSAFSEYGIPKNKHHKLSETLEHRLSDIAQKELDTYIYHELGEASQRKLLGQWWKELLVNLPYSRAELFLRGLKDILSDTCREGMLNHIISEKKAGSLGFYVAHLGGFRKVILQNFVTAYKDFLNTRNWDIIEKARKEGYKKVRGYIKILKEIAHKDGLSPQEIERALIQKITQ